MTSACDRVLSTTELLEFILSHLTPINYLFQAQRVSRFFHTTIQKSPKLQQLLFMRAETCRSLEDYVTNQLLQQHFAPWFPPFQGRRNYDRLKEMEWASTPSLRAIYLRPEASWRRMLPMQPAPQTLSVQYLEHCQTGDFMETASVEGATMGRVYDITESFLRVEYASCAQFSMHCGGEGVVVYLESQMQCDMGEGRGLKGWDLKSEGAEMTHELQWVDCGEVQGGGYRFGGMDSVFD
ncbi:hypothetical protein HBH92_063210 [Parastagonospora nodorum]|nr:hypothetical protein HBH92_063210 [Parastagonospora nodorum]KAH4424338.1 hypothetical protein HBH93_188010 [Parastagonospora nodorum]KAH4457635.1 hypothetical protein HBH91_084450 [Parastagonospora nodorum]KAH4511110.1 hypothetical protein HBH89_043680 [Parastagonospora nodorum]KAH4549299.1 hypothetical protein HBH85_056550 [Parastagonospora nodorum]